MLSFCSLFAQLPGKAFKGTCAKVREKGPLKAKIFFDLFGKMGILITEH